MKTLKITLVCCLFAIAATAQNIITIDNSPQSTTAQQTLQEALDIADAGDMIYLQPTATSYGSATIDKAITIVGRSHSEVNRVSRAGNIIVQASNVVIKGITFGSFSINNGGPVAPPYTGLRLYDSKVNGISIGFGAANIYFNDIAIQGCFIGTLFQGTGAENVLISNNIINSTLSLSAPETVVISNNIFRTGSNSISLVNNSATETAIFFNNMFKTNANVDRTVNLSSGDFNFSNCLTYNYGSGNLTFTVINGGTFLENNSLLNTDPLFVDIDSSVATSLAGNSPSYNPAVRMDDLTLQASSPALTGGGNGGEIGLFNSGFNYNYLGNPRDVPILDIVNYDAAVPKNGTINVTITAKAN